MSTIAFHRSQFRVSANGRHLITGAGAPFVWLADSAIALTRRLDRGDIDLYLRTRAAQRFTVIHTAALSGADARGAVNAYGHLPFEDGDPMRPVEAYFAHLDLAVLRANTLGLAVAIQPLGAELVGPGAFTPASAGVFAAYLARRFRDQAVIWVLGGGEGAEDDLHQTVWNTMGSTLKEHTQGRQLVAYLSSVAPSRGAPWCQGQAWLDLALHRSGPELTAQPWASVAAGYASQPVKPLIDGDPGREDQPAPDGETEGRLSARQERMVAYWSVFAGASGHTYANHSVCCFHQGGIAGDQARSSWEDALHDPAAEQMHFLRHLLESRPFQSRVPDQGLLPRAPADPALHQRATRGDDDEFGGERGSYAFIYTPRAAPVTVDLTRLTGSLVVASWFDPRTGRSLWLGQFPTRGQRTFQPPGDDDWVLVLDDSLHNYQPIGQGANRSMSF